MSPAGSRPVHMAKLVQLTRARSPMAHLIHALNQPLTGLQCSLELAVAGPRSREDYVRTLREGLELTARLRSLVEGIRELSDIEQENGNEVRRFSVDSLLRDAVADLMPLADSKQVSLTLVCQGGLAVSAQRAELDSITFRLLESALALTVPGGALSVLAGPENGRVYIKARWNPTLERAGLDPAELGLLISRAAWEKAGATWHDEEDHHQRTCMMILPLAKSFDVSPTPKETA